MALPYDYYPAVLYAIDLVGQGHTVTSACDEANLPVSTFRTYLKKHTDLQDLYTEADQRGADAMADALINIDNHRVHGQSDPKMAKVISDNIKWVLAKRKPKEFGDRVQVDHSVTVDVAITTALDAARRRVALPDDVIDAEVVQDDDDIMRQLLA
jgi:hypothetical protein